MPWKLSAERSRLQNTLFFRWETRLFLNGPCTIEVVGRGPESLAVQDQLNNFVINDFEERILTISLFLFLCYVTLVI